MRKLFFFAILSIAALGASAAVSTSQARIYINPGHGSWGPNNRHMPTVKHGAINSDNPDTTDFYESNTNLYKCFALFEKLIEYGMPFDRTKNQTNSNPNRIGAALDLSQTNLVMSRVKTGPYPYQTVNGVSPDKDNDFHRPLSEIAAECESWNADMFISVHSNANVDGDNINYLYFAYDGYGSDANKNATSTKMSEAGWNHRILDRHTQWSHYDNKVGAGTVKIAAQKLGVLNHSVPGYLVEGYFHTYQPARHRAMNWDVCRVEGTDYARGVADYFGWSKESYGAIYGVVRDKTEQFSHTYYNPKAGSPDVYKPLNNVEVVLKNSSGQVVDTYKTDDEYNGAFVFKKVQPGNYTIEFSHSEYKNTVYSSTSGSSATSLAVTVKAAVTSYPTAFLLNKNSISEELSFNNKEQFNGLVSKLSGKTVRRQILRNGKVYALAVNGTTPYVYVEDIANNSVTTLGTSAAVGDIYKISDIALTSDNYLVGINKCNQAFGGANNVTAYFWTNDANGTPQGEASVWWTNNFAGNFNNGIAGESVAYSGTLANGNMIYTATTTSSGGNTRLVNATISNGGYTGYIRNNQDGTYLRTGYLGETYNMTLSPRANDQFIFNSAAVQPFEIKLNATNTGVPTILAHLPAVINAGVAGESYFTYGGKSYMVAPAISDGKVSGVKLFNITNGLNKASEIILDGAAIDAVSYSYTSAHGEVVNGSDIVLYLIVDGMVHKFSNKQSPEPEPEPEEPEVPTPTPQTPGAGTANPYAYALKSELNETTLKISYSLNANAENVSIVIKDENGGEYDVIEKGAQSKGAYTTDISVSEYDPGKYEWEVIVDGKEKSAVEEFKAYRFYHPRGIEVDNNMESASFGNVYITEGQLTTEELYWSGTRGGLGLYAFTADMEPIINPATNNYSFTGGWTLNQKIGSSNGADLARVRVAEDGRLFVTRMSSVGNYIMYAPSFEDLLVNNKFTSLFGGLTLDATTYNYTNASGAFMAASNLGFDVKGSGKNLKMIALSSNNNHWAYVYGGARTDEYALGTATTLPVPTNIAALTGKYTIAPQCTNVEYDDRGGVWYCQSRETPNDAQPGLVYVDANGQEKYKDLVDRGGGGIRLSPDGTQIAISSKYAKDGTSHFTIYDITWSESGAPILTPKCVITHGIGTNLYDIAWDLASNIYICGNSGEYLKGFSLPRAEAFTTKAAAKYAFDIIASGVEKINAEEDTEAPVEYYNLNGVKVEKPSNGVFIKVQGNKSSKVYIK
ncbi:MAG: N-acetylmuramoyl-L-alanine amidase [Muribaculaceae bacterium]|nr:N-acetylmuramoyl-L-alanine amidase [Muribaculaceae bacterium]